MSADQRATSIAQQVHAYIAQKETLVAERVKLIA
jgi:hypothetical protein